jgi:hypothetical protein
MLPKSHCLVVVKFKAAKFAIAFTMLLAGFIIFLNPEEVLSFDSFSFG